MKKNCADQHSKRYRKHDPEAACQSLHDCNSDIIGIDDLLIWKIIGIIKKKGTGIGATYTVRKIASGVGVERTFPVNDPRVAKVEVKRHGRVRRAKLYYLRERHGKSARIAEARR